MKNFLATLLVTWCLAANIALAELPPFFNGDKNFPLVLENSQAARYLDKNSVTVEVNDPPFFIITAKILTAGGNETCKFFFDENDVDMRIFFDADDDWKHLNPSDIAAEKNFMYVGEAIFFVAQGRKFYGNYLWKADKKYLDVFRDEFYENLR